MTYAIRLAQGSKAERLKLLAELVDRQWAFEAHPFRTVRVHDLPEAPIALEAMLALGADLKASIYRDEQTVMSNGIDLRGYLGEGRP